MASKSSTVFVSRQDFPEAAINLLKERCVLDIFQSEANNCTTEDLLHRIIGKDALFISAKNNINRDVVNAADQSGLQVIATMSAGLDHIDLEAVKSTKIKIGYTPDVSTEATSEHTVALLLATSRRIVEGHNNILRNKWKTWKPAWLLGKGLHGSSVGFIGFGRIGQSITKKLIPFGISRVQYTGPRRNSEGEKLGATFLEFDVLLKESDFVIVTCPLTAETKGIFTADKFLMMKRSAIFINTARGAIVDQDALLYALENKIIAAAGLDVMTPEPLTAGHPLTKLDNCVITPHMGSATDETINEMAILTAKNILAALDGVKMPAQYIL